MSELIPEPPNKQPYPAEPETVDVETAAPIVTYYQADVQDNQIGEAQHACTDTAQIILPARAKLRCLRA